VNDFCVDFEPYRAGTAIAIRLSMNNSRYLLFAASTALLITACAKGGVLEGEDETSFYVGVGETIEIGDAKVDGPNEIRVRAEGLSVWIRPAIESREVEGEIRFVIRGRASRNLASAFSFVPDDAFGTAALIGRRSFEIELSPHEASSLVFGLPLLLSLDAPNAPHDRYVVQIRGRTRFERFAGSPEMQIDSSITPVLVGSDVLYRGRASVASGHENLAVQIDNAELETVREDERRFRFDVTYEHLASAIHSRTPISFSAGEDASPVRKTALAAMLVSRIALTHLDPYEAWPAATCGSDVLECLRSLGGDVDTEICGDAFTVTRCPSHLPMPSIHAERFATDLGAHLVHWYATYGADVAASGGNDLEAARAAISAALVTEITHPEEDPLGHDLDRVRVLSHPDVVFPGSDRAWIGAYDRETEALIELTDFE
jgi:hypothetical protein